MRVHEVLLRGESIVWNPWTDYKSTIFKLATVRTRVSFGFCSLRSKKQGNVHCDVFKCWFYFIHSFRRFNGNLLIQCQSEGSKQQSLRKRRKQIHRFCESVTDSEMFMCVFIMFSRPRRSSDMHLCTWAYGRRVPTTFLTTCCDSCSVHTTTGLSVKWVSRQSLAHLLQHTLIQPHTHTYIDTQQNQLLCPYLSHLCFGCMMK